VRGEPGSGDGFEDRRSRNPFGIELHVDAAADQIEIERLDAGPRQRTPNQRRFISAIHAGDM
jgi:hypothetical protein